VTLKITLEDSRRFEVQVKKGNNVAIVEVTSTRKLDEMMKDPEGFVKNKMTTGRGNPMSDLEKHAKDYGVRLGVAGVFIYDPEMVFLKKREGILDIIGNVKNPYMETFFFDGENWIRVVSIEVG